MTEQEALDLMVAPGTRRPGKYREGVIQIIITRACNECCYNCTQGSNYGGRVEFMSPKHFEQAVLSLKGYFGVTGVFGGNPAISPHFAKYCEILKKHVPYEQRGLWCNHPLGKGKLMSETFNPAVSNLNVHLNKEAYDEFKRDWPNSNPVGLWNDSRHAPVYVAMKDVLKKECPGCDGDGSLMYEMAKKRCVETNGRRMLECNDTGRWYYATHDNKEIQFKTIGGHCSVCKGTGKVYDEGKAHDLISRCDINQHWSAAIGVFRGELRAYFCEVAAGMAMLHQHEPDYLDTGIPVLADGTCPKEGYGDRKWWEIPMYGFLHQVRQHCHDCGVPLRGYGQLAVTDGSLPEQVSMAHANVAKSKRMRPLEIVEDISQIHQNALPSVIQYLQNAGKTLK